MPGLGCAERVEVELRTECRAGVEAGLLQERSRLEHGGAAGGALHATHPAAALDVARGALHAEPLSCYARCLHPVGGASATVHAGQGVARRVRRRSLRAASASDYSNTMKQLRNAIVLSSDLGNTGIPTWVQRRSRNTVCRSSQ